MIDDADDVLVDNYSNFKIKQRQYSCKPDVVALTAKPKYMYPLFNLFELELNRFNNIPDFALLHNEIISFNQELSEWKNDRGDIKNIFTTYHLYQNLFSRMKVNFLLFSILPVWCSIEKRLKEVMYRLNGGSKKKNRRFGTKLHRKMKEN